MNKKDKKKEIAKKIRKEPLERFEHEYKNKFNKHLKHQKKTNKKLGLDLEFGVRGSKPIQ